MFALACGASWFLYLHRYTWNVIAPYLEQDYGLSKTELGGIYSFFTPTYGLGQIPSGILCDWIGPHFFLGLIIVLWSLLVPLYGVSGGRTGLVAGRLAFGAGRGPRGSAPLCCVFLRLFAGSLYNKVPKKKQTHS